MRRLLFLLIFPALLQAQAPRLFYFKQDANGYAVPYIGSKGLNLSVAGIYSTDTVDARIARNIPDTATNFYTQFKTKSVIKDSLSIIRTQIALKIAYLDTATNFYTQFKTKSVIKDSLSIIRTQIALKIAYLDTATILVTKHQLDSICGLSYHLLPINIGATFSHNSVSYIAPFSVQVASSSSGARYYFRVAGTITALSAQDFCTVNYGTTDYTLFKNTDSTAFKFRITHTASAWGTAASSITGSVSVVPGDYISLRVLFFQTGQALTQVNAEIKFVPKY